MFYKVLFAGTLIIANLSASTTHVYYEGQYESSHWAMKRTTAQDANFIAVGRFGDSEYTIYLNPTDSRGYRSIVSLSDTTDLSMGYNRDYTTHERIGLNLLIALVTEIYAKIGLEAQSAVAGNNSHSFDPETGITYIGSPKEPSMLHGHVMGRGNPSGEYVDGVPLGGPQPGELFDMRGITNIPGNNSKTKWKAGEMEKVVSTIRAHLDETKNAFEALGVEIYY